MSCRPLVAVFVLAVAVCPCAYAQEVDTVAPLLARIEQVAKSGDTAAYLALLTSGANRERAVDFCASELLPGAIASRCAARSPATATG
jgi:hypothetical protein